MGLLFRLPLLIVEWLLRRLLGHRDVTDFAPAPSAPPEAAAPAAPEPPIAFTGGAPSSNGAPPPTADEAIARSLEREAEETAAAAPAPLRQRPLGEDAHVDTEPTLVESFGPSDDVAPTIVVDEPWDGYATMNASSIVQRLRSADAATKAVVALYERGHKNRASVLKATA
jgi:hypothetical protein